MNHNIVITGGSNGFGRALASEFYKRNNNVLICGRNMRSLRESKEIIESNNNNASCRIFRCDVRNIEDVERLGKYAKSLFGNKIDHWINNAGACEGPKLFKDATMKDIETVLSTNLLGTIYGFKVAQNIGTKNIYAVSGHGSNGMSTRDFSLYGASKAAVTQYVSTLVEESNDVNIRILAPGIMKTDLSSALLNKPDMTIVQKFLLTTLSHKPEYVAAQIVPKILMAKGSGIIIRP